MKIISFVKNIIEYFKKLEGPKILVIAFGIIILLTTIFFFRLNSEDETISLRKLAKELYEKAPNNKGNPYEERDKTIPMSIDASADPNAPTPTPDLDPEIPKAAPNFELYDSEGKDVVKLSDYKGKVVFLNFFTTWNPNSQKECEALIRANKEFIKSKKGVILGIGVNEKALSINSYISQNGINFKCLVDTNSEISKKFNITYVPSTCIIGRDGKLYKTKVGIIDEEEMLVLADYL